MMTKLHNSLKDSLFILVTLLLFLFGSYQAQLITFFSRAALVSVSFLSRF